MHTQRTVFAARHCSRDRAQRQQVLGPLAPALPEVPAPDVRGAGRPVHPALLMDQSLLRAAAHQGLLTPDPSPRFVLQVDQDLLPLLARLHSLRRGDLSECTQAPRLTADELQTLRAPWRSTSLRNSQVNISHRICKTCHRIPCGYRLALHKDGVTTHLSRHSWSGRTHSGQIINSTSNEGDDHESQDQCKSGRCRLLLLPPTRVAGFHRSLSSKSARRPKGRRAFRLDQEHRP